jgi:hypothetical protein
VGHSIQSYESHRRWVPAFHFFVLPVLLANVFVTAFRFIKNPEGPVGWSFVVAVALFLGVFLLRGMPLRAQDRVIRLEERARLGGLLPNDLRARVDELTPAQFIALRVAPDDEVPDLTRRTLDGELKTPADLKRAIKNWRADTLRV